MWNKKCGTKIAEQKMVGTIGHWVLGTSSASAKRSAEPKCGTKIGGDSWTSGVGDPKWKCKKGQLNKNAEQKLGGTLFALVLRIPITQCPMVPTNFYSAVFVPHFCSTDLFALALEVANTQCPRVPTNFCSTFLFC